MTNALRTVTAVCRADGRGRHTTQLSGHTQHADMDTGKEMFSVSCGNFPNIASHERYGVSEEFVCWLT